MSAILIIFSRYDIKYKLYINSDWDIKLKIRLQWLKNKETCIKKEKCMIRKNYGSKKKTNIKKNNNAIECFLYKLKYYNISINKNVIILGIIAFCLSISQNFKLNFKFIYTNPILSIVSKICSI